MFHDTRVENWEDWQEILRLGHKNLSILHAFLDRLLLDSFTLTGKRARVIYTEDVSAL